MHNTGAISPDRAVELHEEIENAIDYMKTAVDRLQALSTRISGVENLGRSVGGVGNACDAPRLVPSLSQVLHAGPGKIRDQAERIHELLNSLESDLYGQ